MRVQTMYVAWCSTDIRKGHATQSLRPPPDAGQSKTSKIMDTSFGFGLADGVWLFIRLRPAMRGGYCLGEMFIFTAQVLYFSIAHDEPCPDVAEIAGKPRFN